MVERWLWRGFVGFSLILVGFGGRFPLSISYFVGIIEMIGERI